MEDVFEIPVADREKASKNDSVFSIPEGDKENSVAKISPTTNKPDFPTGATGVSDNSAPTNQAPTGINSVGTVQQPTTETPQTKEQKEADLKDAQNLQDIVDRTGLSPRAAQAVSTIGKEGTKAFAGVTEVAGKILGGVANMGLSFADNMSGSTDKAKITNDNNIVYKTGKYLEDKANEMPDQFKEEWWASIIPKNATALAAFALAPGGSIETKIPKVASAITKAIPALEGLIPEAIHFSPGAATVMGSQGGMDAYHETLKATGDENKALQALSVGFMANGIQGFATGDFLNAMDKYTEGSLGKIIGGALKQGATTSLEQATVQSLAQIGSNLTAQEYYDKTRGILDNVLETAKGGGLMGFAFGAAGKLLKSKVSEMPEGLDKDVLNAKADAVIEKGQDLSSKPIVSQSDVATNDKVEKATQDKQEIQNDIQHADGEAKNILTDKLNEKDAEIKQAQKEAIDQHFEKEAAKKVVEQKQAQIDAIDKSMEEDLSEPSKQALNDKKAELQGDIDKLKSKEEKPTEDIVPPTQKPNGKNEETKANEAKVLTPDEDAGKEVPATSKENAGFRNVKLKETIDAHVDNLSDKEVDDLLADETKQDGTAKQLADNANGAKEGTPKGTTVAQGETPHPENTENTSDTKDTGDKTPKGEKEEGGVGISHELQGKRAERLAQEEVERGEGVSNKESIEHGQKLLNDGGDADKVAEDFKKDKKISYDDISLIRAKAADLAKDTQKTVDKFGQASKEAGEAIKNELEWLRDVVKPMQTEWSKIGQAQQGSTDIETGSVLDLRRAVNLRSGRDINPKQMAEAKDLVDKIKTLEGQLSDVTKQLDEAHQKAVSTEEKSVRFKERTSGKALIAEGVDDLAKALGVIKNLEGEKNPEISKAVGKIARGLLDEGLAGANNLWEKVKEHISTNIKQDISEQYKQDALNELDKDDDIFIRFVNKKGNDFTPHEAKEIWDYTKKNYIDTGSKFADAVSGTATDLGLSSTQVKNAIASPKGANKITNEAYMTQRQRNKAVQNAKDWVKTTNESKFDKAGKAIANIPDFIRSLRVALHGSVAVGTHYGMEAFNPLNWKNFFKAAIRGFTYSYGGIRKGGAARYDQAMSDMMHDPVAPIALRAGLQIDPNKISGDYAPSQHFFGRIQEMGDRGFNSMKPLRLAMFRDMWENQPNIVKQDPEFAKTIAGIVNNSTGYNGIFDRFDPKAKKALNAMFFAPKLIASQLARFTTEPGQAAITLARMVYDKATGNSFVSPTEKAVMKIVGKRTATILATYAAAGAINQGLLSATGSNQKLNWTDWTKPDFLKFKGFGQTFDFSSGMVSTFKMLANVADIPFQNEKDLHNKERKEAVFSNLGSFARGKFSPGAGLGFDFFTHKDFAGNVLPMYDDKPKGSKRQLSWGEFIGTNVLNIPAGEFITDVAKGMNENGMSKPDVNLLLNSALKAGFTGALGDKIGDEPKENVAKEKSDARDKINELKTQGVKWKDMPQDVREKAQYTLRGVAKINHEAMLIKSGKSTPDMIAFKKKPYDKQQEILKTLPDSEKNLYQEKHLVKKEPHYAK